METGKRIETSSLFRSHSGSDKVTITDSASNKDGALKASVCS